MCKTASQAVLSRKHLSLHATRRTSHGASCLVLAVSAWSVKTRRAPPLHCIEECEGLRLYDYSYELHGYPPSRGDLAGAKYSYFVDVVAFEQHPRFLGDALLGILRVDYFRETLQSGPNIFF